MKIKQIGKKITVALGAGIVAVSSAVATYTPNYTPSDMPNIATDLIGTAGVDLKTYIPLFILMFVVVFFTGRIMLLRDAYGR